MELLIHMCARTDTHTHMHMHARSDACMNTQTRTYNGCTPFILSHFPYSRVYEPSEVYPYILYIISGAVEPLYSEHHWDTAVCPV